MAMTASVSSRSTPPAALAGGPTKVPIVTIAAEFQGLRAVRSMPPSAKAVRSERARHEARSARLMAPTSRGKVDHVKLQVTVDHEVKFGESVGILGSANWLGRWDKPVEMRWTEAGWTVEVEARPGDEAEFKFVVCGQGNSVQAWENGPNRRFQVPSDVSMVKASAKWGTTAEGLTVVHTETHTGNGAAVTGTQEEGVPAESAHGASAFALSWQGKDVSFMRSNQHARERGGMWNTTGLSGPVLTLVAGDRDSGNWWRKLELVQNLLTSTDPLARLDPLVYSAIYLQWINTGQIACVEDGGHHRPNRHAQISRSIFRLLEKDSAQQALAASPQAMLVTRKVHPRLPAFTSEFTASVPLTRIRDIAHRNDIPHDLKQEIKHTIQNKLHRNAGPEDLVATELLLRRVTASEGEYSAAFIEQLRIFYRELKDFFNASSLQEQLDAIRSSLDEAAAPMLDNFLACKKRVDELAAGDARSAVDAILAALHSLTGLRATLLYHLNSGLRNDAPDEAIAMRQKWRLSEIGLEDYSFVLLSRLLNEVESQGGSQTMSAEAERGAPRLLDACLGAAVLALRQVGLSGWEQAECLCLEHELAAWQAAGIGERGSGGVVTQEDVRWWALRVKASLDRAKRLAAHYTDTVLTLYSTPAQVLGRALGIEENAVKTFAEAEIRASVVFQLDKLLTVLLKAVRSVLRSEGWDVLMPGSATGSLKEVETIDPASLQRCSSHTILLVHRAEGDEEVRAAGNQVKAIILLQELPHLSHLAVRARQEKVPFVTCEDHDWIVRLKAAAAASQRIRLEASAEGVRVLVPAPAEEPPPAAPPAHSDASTSSAPRPSRVAANKEVVRPVIPLVDATLDTCGAKAAACAKLLTLSASSLSAPDSDGAFHAPQGAVLPFGALEDAVRSQGLYAEYQAGVDATETAPLEHLGSACLRLQSLIQGLKLPHSTLGLLAGVFPGATRLIVRSSANVEDLAGMSGAGLYDSIPNVRLTDPEALTTAVAAVWASLYSRRAVLSRRAAGVRQADAAMAVLVQELMAPDLSFVLHTKSLVDGSTHQVHAEIAPGLGETLASGTRGTAWRLVVDKASNELSLAAFANFSEQLVVVKDGPGDGTVARRVVDYSRQQLSVDRESLRKVAIRLCKVGQLLESNMGCAQDIEGCLVGPRLVVVQTRPQP